MNNRYLHTTSNDPLIVLEFLNWLMKLFQNFIRLDFEDIYQYSKLADRMPISKLLTITWSLRWKKTISSEFLHYKKIIYYIITITICNYIGFTTVWIPQFSCEFIILGSWLGWTTLELSCNFTKVEVID